ncbi:MAG: hypothetical protein K2X81_02780 [Candidatus Obscuribacterales bacterium]|nr:hypothetical protein [Candidatus Obscuribacterales bacterium]
MARHSTSTKSAAKSYRCSPSIVKAQNDFFIALGSIDELNPNDFGRLLNLGNAIIEGNIFALIDALSFYKGCPALLFDQMDFLRSAIDSPEISFPDPDLIKYEGNLGQSKTALVFSIYVERSQRIAYISSDPNLPSYVHALTTNKLGIETMQPVSEDPLLLLRHIGRLICLPEHKEPPPMSALNVTTACA